MSKIKDISERLGAKKLEARKIITDAETAKRDLTVEERAKVSGLQNDCDALSEQLVIESRQLQLEGQKALNISEKEKREIARADLGVIVRHLHAHAKGSTYSKLEGIEQEMVQEGEREARAAGIQSGGIYLPRVMVRTAAGLREQRDLSVGVNADGGFTVATEKRGLLDDFFNASVMRQAGATVYEGLSSNLDLPRIIAGTAPTGKAENASADETSPTFAVLSLAPKRLPVAVDISERLLIQSSAAIETAVKNLIVNQMLAVQEAAFFHGSGTNEASGIAGTANIGSVAGGTNGLAPNFSHMVGLETAVDTVNALLGNLRYVSNGQVRGKLKQTQKVSGTDSRMILDNDGLINGYSPLFTNAVSRTLTKGTSSGVCSAIFFGNFSDYAVGYWGGLNLEMIRDTTNALTGQYKLVASVFYDGGVQRPKSFAAMLDALAA